MQGTNAHTNSLKTIEKQRFMFIGGRRWERFTHHRPLAGEQKVGGLLALSAGEC
jgi:hypothetical protein